MPTAYIQKLAKEHNMSSTTAENRWKNAKKAAIKQGHSNDFGYITSIFKNMMGESAKDLNLMQFLIITEMDDVGDMSYGGHKLKSVIGPDEMDQDEFGDDEFNDEDEFSDDEFNDDEDEFGTDEFDDEDEFSDDEFSDDEFNDEDEFNREDEFSDDEDEFGANEFDNDYNQR